MKKVFTLFALVLLASAVTMKAQKYYTVPGFETKDCVKTLEPGAPVVIHPLRADTLAYFYNGGNFYPYGYNLNVINESCVYTFEEAGEIDGYMTYYFKNYNTGKYLLDLGYTDGSVLFNQTTTARAQRFFVQNAKTIYKQGGRRPAGWDYRSTTYWNGVEPTEDCFILTLADTPWPSRPGLYFSWAWYGKGEAGVRFSEDMFYNTCYFYTPQEIHGYDVLKNVVSYYYPNADGKFNLSWIYPVPEALVEEAAAAYEHAVALLEDTTQPASVYDAEATRISELHERYESQGHRNYSASTTVSNVSKMVNAGYTYKDLPIARSSYEDQGLVTDTTQLWSNSKYELAGSYLGLIDGDLNTYFRANANSEDIGNMYYYIAADLRKKVQDITFKYTIECQTNSTYNTAPRTMHVYGSDNGENWVTEGYVSFSTSMPATLDVWHQNEGKWYESETKADLTGMASVHLSRPYQYLRLDAEGTQWGNPDKAKNYYWALAELHYYETPVDMDNSLNRLVNPDTLAYVEEQIALSNVQLGQNMVTDEQLDLLLDAYERYWNQYPARSKVEDAIAAAQVTHDAADEDTSERNDQVGFVDPGSKAVLQEVIDDVKAEFEATRNLSQEHIDQLIGKLEAAVEAFNENLHKPIDGHLYQIKSVSTKRSEATKDWYLYAPDNNPSQILLGGHDVENNADDIHITNRLNCYWKAIDNGDGTYKFQNVGTGTYMGSGFKSNNTFNMSLDADTVAVRLQSAGAGSAFNIVVNNKGGKVFAYAEGLYHSCITWNEASGDDYCAFVFIDATYDFKDEAWIDGTKPRFLTLPYDIYGDYEDQLLSFKGYNPATQTLEFDAVDGDDIVPAGTPLLFAPLSQDDETAPTGLLIATAFDDILDIDYQFEPVAASTQNGLQGTIEGVANNGYIVLDDAGENAVVGKRQAIAANSAYLTDLYNADVVAQTDEAGTISIPVDEAVTGVFTVVRNQKGVVTYDLQGRRVNAAAKGVYIQGGKKVLVK